MQQSYATLKEAHQAAAKLGLNFSDIDFYSVAGGRWTWAAAVVHPMQGATR